MRQRLPNNDSPICYVHDSSLSCLFPYRMVGTFASQDHGHEDSTRRLMTTTLMRHLQSLRPISIDISRRSLLDPVVAAPAGEVAFVPDDAAAAFAVAVKAGA